MGSLVFAADGKTATINGAPFNNNPFFYVSTNTQSAITVSSSLYWIGIGINKINGVVVSFWVSSAQNSTTNPHPAGNITVSAGNAPPVIIPVSQLQW
jgi:hypothetical protein